MLTHSLDSEDLKIDEKYMRRALQLAKNGEGRVSPNPMVGAVIVNGDRIIGEGYHAFYGGPHAEVNAVNSVKQEDEPLLKDSTIYVTLEPCAHYGKTPPCANLIVAKGIPRVVIGSPDPNPLVAGKGVKILEDAGIEVEQGCLEQKCNEINKRFLKTQNSPRPWIILKWAQSADGFIAGINDEGECYPVKFSNALSSVWMHRERGKVDAILIGGNTERIDHPKLDTRLWGANAPKKYVIHHDTNIPQFLEDLKKNGTGSLMVEGGASILNYFINKGLFDEIRVETSPKILGKGLKAPNLPSDIILTNVENCRNNLIRLYSKV